MIGRAKRANRNGGHEPVYEQLLLFPERAEYLHNGSFGGYRVRLDHWRELASAFRRGFEAVYVRRSAAILLVHGPQGTGKTLFTQKILEGFKSASNSALTADPENLWHVLSGGGELIDLEKVQETTPKTYLTRVLPETDWLSKAASHASSDTHAMRVYLFDDFQKDVFRRELAGLTQAEFLNLKAAGKSDVATETVAQRLVEELRGRFARSLFVILSNDEAYLADLHKYLELSHQGLAATIKLPLPEPELKEHIVRTNTNRLNPRSYWHCLDVGGPDETRVCFEGTR